MHLAPAREDVISRFLKNETEESGDSSAEESDVSAPASGTAVVLPKNRDWAASAASIVCNGPFRVQAMEEDRSLTLERNSYYMREDDQALDKYVLPYRLTCLFYEDMVDAYGTGRTQLDVQTERYNNGQLFYLSGFTKDTYASFQKQLTMARTLNGYAYYFNTKNELLSNQKVRQALSAALDRNKIVTEITGTGETAATGYVPAGVFDTGKGTDFRTVGGNLYNTAADVDQARSLLSGANSGGTTLRLIYLIPQSETLTKEFGRTVSYPNVYEELAKYAKSAWESLGFKIELQGLHYDKFLRALYDRDYDIMGLNIVTDSTDAFGYLAPFATKYSGSVVDVETEEEPYTPHYTNFENAQYDALADEVCYMKDRAARAQKLHEMEQALVEQCPATMVYWYNNSYVASDQISNVKTESYFGFRMLNDLKLKNWREVNASEAAAAK